MKDGMETLPVGHAQPRPKRRHDLWERRLAVAALVTIIVAWIIGGVLHTPEQPSCDLAVLPGAMQCRTIKDGLFEGYQTEADGSQTIVGWASIASARGYSGDIQVIVGVNPAGDLLGIKVLHQTETTGFYTRVDDSDFFASFANMRATSPFVVGQDVDSVTRATVSARAISEAVRKGSYTIAEEQLGLKVTEETKPIQFGIPEIVLISLYISAFIGHRRGFKYKKQMRWATMLVGLIALGFVYNIPLALANFTSLLTGLWPDWRTNLFWFLLLGGILFVVTTDGKNPYCSWFCPFGAAQECLGAVGRAKFIQPRRGRQTLKWIQRGLAWSAIVLALLLRNPGISSYEIFGTLFSFSGVPVQWIILVTIVLLSLFVQRPWCHFLCPIDPVVDFVSAVRRWVRELWQNKRSPKGEPSPMPLSSSSSESASS